ncbi:MAG TPA: polyprenyl synthetase family protein, partial [Bacteroidales bacterium]|nr:polyprenyl synthetase family protein [Bacteroidales bacterium]
MKRLNSSIMLINKDLEVFAERMKAYTHTNNQYVATMLQYILQAKGKLIRPVIVYLSARMFGEPGETTHSGAVLMELIHSSTLVHDDVV